MAANLAFKPEINFGDDPADVPWLTPRLTNFFSMVEIKLANSSPNKVLNVERDGNLISIVAESGCIIESVSQKYPESFMAAFSQQMYPAENDRVFRMVLVFPDGGEELTFEITQMA